MRVWQCPGPQRFLKTLAENLADSHSVVLRVPPLAPDGLENELTLTMREGGWLVTRIEDNGNNPARQVLVAARVEEGRALEVKVSSLFEFPELAGKVFWCVPKNAEGARRWLTFLDELVVARRANPDVDAPRFVLSLAGQLACPSPPRKVGIDLMDVHTALSQTDLLLLAYYQTGATQGGTLKSQIMAQTAASVALWDLALLNRLLEVEPETLFAPVDFLKEYAAEQGWDINTPCNWENGTCRQMEHAEEVHSAHIALNDKEGLVPTRVWAGQAAVLLPVIERRKMDLIRETMGFLECELPFKTDYETVTDVYRLDIGPIYFLLKKKNASHTAQTKALRLKKSRDCLAHMEPLTAADALATVLIGS